MLTVVIPVYNRAHTVGRMLESLSLQTERPAAVVLVDNNSTDGSLDLCKSWAQARRDEGWKVDVVDEAKPGASAARNRGLEQVDTPWVMFFDSDDEMLPTHIHDFMEAVRRNPDADIVGRTVKTGLPNGKFKKGYFSARDSLFHNIFRGSMSTMRWAALTSLVWDVGAWDESVRGWDDMELGTRMLLSANKVVEVGGEPTAVSYYEEQSLTGSNFASRASVWEHSLDLCRRDVTVAGRRDLLKWIDARAMVLAAHYGREGATGEAERLAKAVLDRTPHKVRMRLLYWHNRCFKRLTWVAARILFPFG